jgi:hypothetical protein
MLTNNDKKLTERNKMKKIYYCATGSKCSDGKSYTDFKLFDFEDGEEKGKGFQYSVSGERYGHWWCHTESSEEIGKVSEEIVFSFRHGSSSFYVLDEDVKERKTFIDLIEKSDFKFVTKQEIEDSRKRDTIKTIEDIKENWDFLDNVGFGLNQAKICLENVGFKIPAPVNGEIGILAYQIMSTFSANKDKIKELL